MRPSAYCSLACGDRQSGLEHPIRTRKCPLRILPSKGVSVNDDQLIQNYIEATLSRRDLLKGAGSAAGLMLLAACTPGGQSSTSAPSATVTYLAAANFIGSWNPFDNLILIHMRAQRIVYDYLMWIDNSGNFVPGLATSFENV